MRAQTHGPSAPFQNEPFHLNPNRPESCSAAKYGDPSSLGSRGSAADKPTTRSSTLGPLGPAHGQLCLIVQFIKRGLEEEDQEEEWRRWAAGLCTQLALMRLCKLVSIWRCGVGAGNTTPLSQLKPRQCTEDRSKPKRAGFTGFEEPRRD